MPLIWLPEKGAATTEEDPTMTTRAMNTRAKLTGAAIGAIAITASVFALTGSATADDSESIPETDETFEAEYLDDAEIGDDVEIIELDEGDLDEVYLGETDGETFEAEYLDDAELGDDVITIDITEADEANGVVEYELD